MKQVIDYSKSPAKAFDAVEDIRNYLGDRYDTIANHVKTIKSPRIFGFACSFTGIEGYPVRAWYDHFHGQGAYDRAWDELEGGDDMPVEA